MLVLSRKRSESIQIGDNVFIKVIKTGADGGPVKIGIDAPDDVRIVRSELLENPPNRAA